MRREFYLLYTVLLALIFSVVTDTFGNSRTLDDPYETEWVAPPLDTIPFNDRSGDFINDPNENPFDLKDPKQVEKSVEYDPESNSYIITERIGDDFFRPPTYMTIEEYLDYRAKQQQDEYFKSLNAGSSGVGQRGIGGKKDPLGDIDIADNIINRLFGGTEVDIQPQGSIDLTFGVDYSRIENPALPLRQQRISAFDFDMAIQMNVQGSIGEKLKLNTDYNTQATFDFDNIMRLQYGTDNFGEDEIIKNIEAGNVALPLPGTLIQGAQSLFGLKVETQWGRLRLTGIASQQKSERETIVIEDGGQIQRFTVDVDDYDENRHFFLTHYNRETYELALQNLPQLNTNFSIEELQVFVKPTSANQTNVFEVVALTDLGETERITNPDFEPVGMVPANRKDCFGNPLPDNDANPLYQKILQGGEDLREADRVVSQLQSGQFGLEAGKDFERITAVVLNPNQYTFHPQLGFVSLGVNIPPDQVVGVSFRYSYQNEVYTVGEFTDNTDGGDTITQSVIFTKMLKSTVAQVQDPIFDLMMKNVYSINGFQIDPEDFRLDIRYADAGISEQFNLGNDDNQIGKKIFLPIPGLDTQPLLQLFGLDRLNTQLDPQIEGDGRFDFVPGVTILPRSGKIIFPKVEPFGQFLRDTILATTGNAFLANTLAYDTLYRGTVTDAREEAAQNRFTIEGQYKSAVSADISLGAFNIPPGSERVTAGGRLLVRDVDYTIDYTIGRIKILNEAILASGSRISVDFEDSALFGFQQKTMLGIRADYQVNKNLNIGGTFMQLFERPFTQKVNIGDDPINNRIYGLDVNYSDEAPWLTKAVDAIPGLNTKTESSINFSAEAAYLAPGHSRAINQSGDPEAKELFGTDDRAGVIYIDDFEGTTSQISQIFPTNGPNGWVLASTPQNDMFPESQFSDNPLYGVNRAKLNWMVIQPQFQNQNGGNPYSQRLDIREIFENRQIQQNGVNVNLIRSLDVEYCPDERGPYNYDPPSGTAFSAGLNSQGKLEDPASRWAGIMRSITTNDFQAANIEFVEFWLLDPFLDTLGTGTTRIDALDGKMDGEMYFEFGNVSEDVLRDGRKFFENGLPGPNTDGLRTVPTEYGRVPVTQQITNAFDIDPANREAQDAGFDGIPDELERQVHADYIAAVNSSGITNQQFLDQVFADPSNDNYRSFQDYPDTVSAFTRYSRFYGMEGNSPVDQGSNNVRTGSTLLPDMEDLDRDNTLNELESYFQYRVPIEFNSFSVEENPYIIDAVTSNDGERTWYRFKIPLDQEEEGPDFKRIGDIDNFRSIRFMRMYFKGFEAKMYFRFGTFDLVRSQWRRFQADLSEEDCPIIGDQGGAIPFDVNAVSFEETTGYVLPPGIRQEQALGVNINALQNEQALAMTVCDLPPSQGKAIYKLVNMDMRQFETMRMFVHAQSSDACLDDSPLDNGDLTVFVRLGTDLTQNYYEYELPLVFTPQDTISPNNVGEDGYNRVIWPLANEVNINFKNLVNMKRVRNLTSVDLGRPYELDVGDVPDNSNITFKNLRESETYKIIGNPNIGDVRSIMIGVRNPCEKRFNKSAEVWVNELRVLGLDEAGAAAATARLDLNLADFGSVTLSGLATGIGYGQIDDRVNERSQERIVAYDIATQLALDKFLPEKWGINLPFYYQFSREISTPEFDPYDLDVKLKDKIEDEEKIADGDPDLVREQAQTVTTIETFNFTNVRKERTNEDKKPMPWDISNFSLDYMYEETTISDPFIEEDVLERQRGALTYQYKIKSKPIKPFDKLIKDSKYLKFIKDINFNPIPSSIGFSTDLDRKFNRTTYRFAGDDVLLNTYFNKQMLWNRSYDLNWDPFKALKVRYFADFRGVIDEPTEKSLISRSRLNPSDPQYIESVSGERRRAIFEQLGDLGRPKDFQQNINLTLKIPLDKFPFLDWINATATYDGGYRWVAASLDPFAQSFGNVIENNQTRSLRMDFKFDKLYKYSKYLKSIESKPRRKRGSRRTSSARDREKEKESEKEDDDSKKKKDKKRDGPSKIERALVRPLLLVRSLQVDINQDFRTQIPGYQHEVDFFGLNNFTEPGWDFVFGLQPNLAQADQFTERNWLYSNREFLVRNPKLFQKVEQTKNNRFRAELKLEPLKDFRIDIQAERTITERHTERFAFDEEANDFLHAINNDFGSYEISYFAAQTLFQDSEADLDRLYETFRSNQVIISNRLAPADDDRLHEKENQADLGFRYGYGWKHPSVTTFAFIAAFTGQNAQTIDISEDYTETLFDQIPRLNWRVNYSGLSKLPIFGDAVQSLRITHGYQSRMRVASFQTNLEFDPFEQVYQEGTQSNNYVSRFNIPTLSIEESFSPLIGIDMRLKNSMTFRFEAKKARQLTLNVENESYTHSQTEDWTFGFGYTLKDIKFDFLSKKKKKPRGDDENGGIFGLGGNRNNNRSQGDPGDLTLSCDFSLRDDIENFYEFVNDFDVPSRGTRALTLSPAAEYRISQQLALRAFCDYRKTTPKLSNAFPTTNVAAGFTLRFQLQ